ncbi:lipopolysaccharide biosynthesis protein [Agromyces allii]|uniref:Lipopolysaccharide biosynthesis protein n=1 Tax=Agromyces allii TaxID=393607 RepID=A0ABN2R1U2_9MICO
MSRGARGGAALIVGQFLKLAIQFASLVLLSRLLAPEDFGLVAMVSVFLALGSLLRDFGMPTAALQAKRLTDQQASNFFWASTVLGIAAAVLLSLVSPLLASLYAEPRLLLIAPAMSVTLALSGAQAQLQVQLARASRFTSLAVTDVVAQGAALVVALFGAAAGWGYWAIVVQPVVATALLLLLRASLLAWIPRLPRRGHETGALFRVGWDIGLAQLLAFAANNVDTLVIGLRWGPGQLGFYNRAFQLYTVPRSGVLDPLTQVALPTLSAAVERGRKASDLLLRIQFTLSAALSLAYLIAATTADWLLPLLLGEQWSQAVGPFQVLALGGFFAAFGTVSYWVFLLEGKSRQLLYLHLVTKPMMVALVLCGLPFGITGVAAGYALAQALAWPINLFWLSRVAQQDSWAYFRTGLRTLVPAGVAFALTRVVLVSLDMPGDVAPTIVGSILATAFFFGVMVAIPGGYSHLAAALRLVPLMVRRRLLE